MSIREFFKNAFADMRASAKAQHEVDKAEFTAAKAEARANFEENRGHNTYARAKAAVKENWDAARAGAAGHADRQEAQHQERLAQAEARRADAEARIEAAKK